MHVGYIARQLLQEKLKEEKPTFNIIRFHKIIYYAVTRRRTKNPKFDSVRIYSHSQLTSLRETLMVYLRAFVSSS